MDDPSTMNQFHVLDRVTKLEEEFSHLRKKVTDSDWEAKTIEQLRKGDIQAAVDIFQEFHYGANMSAAMGHVMEIKKKIGK